MNVDYFRKAKTNLIGFVDVIKELIEDRKIKFDLVTGSGDSGAAMVKIAEMIYQELKISFPEKLLVPYFRFTKKDVPSGERVSIVDYSDSFEEKFRSFKEVKNILFVDDEIGRGRTIRGVVKWMRENNPKVFSKDSRLWIVAEDHGFNVNDLKLDFVVEFKPFSKKEGINNAISYIVPYEIKSVIRENFSGKYSSKELMNSLLGLPVKSRDRKVMVWSYDLRDELAGKIEGFDGLQNEFEKFLRDLIRKSLKVRVSS